MNLSHSQFGSVFAAYAYGLDNISFELPEVFEKAEKIARLKQKSVILYSEQISPEQSYSICAIVSDKYKIEYYDPDLTE